MAAITGDETQPTTAISADQPDSRPTVSLARSIPPLYRWAAAIAALLVVLVVCLLVWGSGMEYPTTVAYVASSDGTTQFPKSLRDVTGGAIDAGAKWVTREASWLFGGIKNGIIYALGFIEDVLKWVPWPALVLGLALASFAVGRWALMMFTLFAMLFIGFMDLWENAIDTIALMAVAVALSVGIGLPLGVMGARSQRLDNLMRPILDGMQTMPSFVYLLPGHSVLWSGQAGGNFCDHHLRRTPGN